MGLYLHSHTCFHIIQERNFTDFFTLTAAFFLSLVLSQHTPDTLPLADVTSLHSLAVYHPLQHVRTYLVFMRQWLDIRGEGHGIWFICSILINYATSYSFSSSQLLHFHLYCYHHLSFIWGKGEVCGNYWTRVARCCRTKARRETARAVT
jgi:hypothetical protein